MKVIKDTDLYRYLITVVLLMSLSFAARTEELPDSVFTFRFVTGRNMFYSPFKENEGELARLFECVDLYKDRIMKHKGSVKVNGYCISGKGSVTDMRIARIRSNRVKSELITRKGLTEECFTTRNQVGTGNYVTVSFSVPKELIVPPVPEVERPEATDVIPVEEETVIEEMPLDDGTVQLPESPETEAIPDTLITTERSRQDSPFALKTNLLDYAILMPNLELEWKCARRWSVALEGQIAWWSKESSHKTYRVATLIPEARYWVIDRSKWHGMYVGLFGGIGIYDLHRGYTH
ncbi:MAG: DUF3575 domain-containing protein, partial [Muribaculaceae bacterium]|nr:DUF3575 domain-containing protein [Muribaculaceae bacterium]